MPDASAANSLVKPVKVLAEIAAPAVATVDVQLHYVEDGAAKRVAAPTPQPPVIFDRTVITSTPDELPAVEFALSAGRSPKDLARNVFYTARKLKQGLSGARKFGTPVIDVRGIEPNNVAHILTDILPRYLLAKSVAGGDLTLLLKRQPVGTFLELFRFFGAEPVVETGKVAGDVIRIQGMRALAAFEPFGRDELYGLHLYPDVYVERSFPAEKAAERIFLARRPPRDLVNQAEIEAMTTRYGYRTLYMEDYSIADQLGIGARAKHVVAVHGAAMSFLAANPAIGSVVEFFPPNVHHQMFPGLFGTRVGAWHQVVPQYDARVQLSGWPAVLSFKNKNFAVDTKTLEAILAEIHGKD